MIKLKGTKKQSILYILIPQCQPAFIYLFLRYISFWKHTGFYFILGALTIEQQCQWIKESLTSFPQPPNRTNHNAFYGPINDLFIAAKERKVLLAEENSNSEYDPSVTTRDAQAWKFCEEHEASSKGNSGKSISASVLLRKLRWSTLGLQFDWSKVLVGSFFNSECISSIPLRMACYLDAN